MRVIILVNVLLLPGIFAMNLFVCSTQKEHASKFLGVTPDDEPGEIRRAFRKLAIKCHPDLNGGNPEMENRFKILNEAYQTILASVERENKLKTRFYKNPQPIKSGDLRYRLNLDPYEAMRGGEVLVRYMRPRSNGKGNSVEPTVLKISLPRRMEGGSQIRISKYGKPGMFGGDTGDLFIIVYTKQASAAKAGRF
jgi:DnaJ-class molecular chaperone